MKLPYSLERDSALVNASMNLFFITVLILYRAGLQLDEKASG